MIDPIIGSAFCAARILTALFKIFRLAHHSHGSH
jgi:hypothetical protein